MDELYMRKALECARKSLENDDVPVGAVIVHENKIIASGFNTKVKENDPLGHAEVNVLREAVKNTGQLYLEGMSMYVTLEPCIMCAGALLLSRIARIVIGCEDKKTGAFGSIYDFSKDNRLNHKIEVLRGVCEAECRELLQNFFKKLREG